MLFPERKRFYQDVSISQGEGTCLKSSVIDWGHFGALHCDCSAQPSSMCDVLDLKNTHTLSCLNDIFQSFLLAGLYEINLDRRKLKTPGGKLFTVPNEALAIAVATEWDAQRDTLKFYTMHLVRLEEGLCLLRIAGYSLRALFKGFKIEPSSNRHAEGRRGGESVLVKGIKKTENEMLGLFLQSTLCNTALDNPTQRNKDQMITAALKFLETDTVWYTTLFLINFDLMLFHVSWQMWRRMFVLCSYRVDEPNALVELQKNEWDPVLHWMEKR